MKKDIITGKYYFFLKYVFCPFSMTMLLIGIILPVLDIIKIRSISVMHVSSIIMSVGFIYLFYRLFRSLKFVILSDIGFFIQRKIIPYKDVDAIYSFFIPWIIIRYRVSDKKLLALTILKFPYCFPFLANSYLRSVKKKIEFAKKVK